MGGPLTPTNCSQPLGRFPSPPSDHAGKQVEVWVEKGAVWDPPVDPHTCRED